MASQETMPQAITQRYARALAEVVRDPGKYRSVQEELASFASVYRESPELRDALDSPAVEPAQKMRVLERIMRLLELSGIVQNFLRVLQSHYRLNLIDEIRAAFERVMNEQLGIVRVTIVSAAALSAEQQAALETRFIRLTRKKLETEYRIDPELLGGIRAAIESTVFDGTVRGNLSKIREEMESA